MKVTLKKNVKGFIRTTIIQVIVIAVFWSVLLALANTPMINNEIALGQMESSNIEYAIWSGYQRFIPIVRFAINAIGSIAICRVLIKVCFYVKDYFYVNKEKN